jgi:cell division protein FtsZ
MEAQTQPKVWPTLTLIGVGRGGCILLDHAIEKGLLGIDSLAIDTDPLTLERSNASKKISLGNRSGRGLDGDGDPEKSKEAAEYARTEISAAFQNSELVLLMSALGGGAGSGATPVVARLAKESGALTIALVTQPFYFEGKHRARNGAWGEAGLQNNVDALAVFYNDQLLSRIDRNTRLLSAFEIINDLLYTNIEGIVELYTSANGSETLRTFWKEGKRILLASGTGSSALAALQNAIGFNLTNLSLGKAKNLLVQLKGGLLEPSEVETARDLLRQYSGCEVKFFSNPCAGEEFQVTLFANGFAPHKV